MKGPYYFIFLKMGRRTYHLINTYYREGDPCSYCDFRKTCEEIRGYLHDDGVMPCRAISGQKNVAFELCEPEKGLWADIKARWPLVVLGALAGLAIALLW